MQSKRLGDEITRAMTRARLNSVQLGKRAGVGASWIRQVQSGRIAKPAADKLARIAEVLGLDLEPLLAMSDQLGKAEEVRRVQPVGVTVEALEEAMRRANQPLVEAMQAQTAAYDRLAAEIRTAALKVTGSVGASAELLGMVAGHLGVTLPQTEDEHPRERTRLPAGGGG